MKREFLAACAALVTTGVLAALQYGQDYVRSDLIQYNSDNPQTTYSRWGIPTTDYANHGFSYISVGSGVSGLKISFSKMQDLYQSPIGFYSYTGDFATLADRQRYIEEFRASHPEAELGHGNTAIELSGLNEDSKVGFYMLSDARGNGRDVTLVSQFNFRDATASYNGLSSRTVGGLMPSDYGDTSIAVYFGDYSTTPWRYNDVVKIETAVVRTMVDDGMGGMKEVDITLDDSIPGGSSIVDVPKEEAPAGQPLPGALAVFAVAGLALGALKLKPRIHA